MGATESWLTSLTIVYSTVYSDADQRKHQSSASLAFVQGIHRWPVNSPHKGPVTRKMIPFDDVIMDKCVLVFYEKWCRLYLYSRIVVHFSQKKFNWLVVNLLIPCVITTEYGLQKCVTIGSVNGLSPVRRLAIAQTRLIDIGPTPVIFESKYKYFHSRKCI